MRYLKISNKGLLDHRLVSLMGGTTKTGQHKIGEFGSGLKYVLAFLFREKMSFKIFIGENELDISIREEIINEVTFEVIYINNERTSITTRMGKEWEAWMICRELYSNALDEGEAEYKIVEGGTYSSPNIKGEKDRTTFYLEVTIPILQVFNNWRTYFIVDNVPIFENEDFAIHAQEGPFRLYKQGIMIHENLEHKSLFNYDLKNASINELREYKGSYDYDIAKCLFKITDKKVIEYFLENVSEENHVEGKIDLSFDWYGKFNEIWKEAIGKAKLIHKEAKDKILGATPTADLSHTLLVPKNIFKALTKTFEGIGALRVINKIKEFYEVVDPSLDLKLKQCLAILEEAGYFIHPELKFIFGDFGDKSVLAEIKLDSKEVFISQKVKDVSLFKFCTILIEENEHFNTGFNDNTREFQQHFIDLYTKTMLEKAEIKL